MTPTSKSSTAAVLALIAIALVARVEGAPSHNTDPQLGLELEAPTNEDGLTVDRVNDYDDVYYVDDERNGANDPEYGYKDPCAFQEICETLALSVDSKRNHRVQDSNFVISSNPPKSQAAKTPDLYKFSINDLVVDCNDMLIKCSLQGSQRASPGNGNVEQEAETK
ncbi:uncharacterized protein [Macrobrachium rosenbergii]